MRQDGVDLIDVSTGGLTPTAPKAFPGYQVPYAATIREEAAMMTGAVGIIVTGVQAEEILQQGSADLVIIGRELLRNPYFPLTAAKELGVERTKPVQYLRSFR